MKSDLEENLIKLENFPFIKAYLGEFHEEFYEEMII